MVKASKTIESIRIVMQADSSPDMSTLGYWTDDPISWAIDCRSGKLISELESEQREAELAEWQQTARKNGYTIADDGETITDDNPQLDGVYFEFDGVKLPSKSSREFRFFVPYAGGELPSSEHYREYALQDWKRAESLNNGDWCYCGVDAVAKLRVNGISQEVQSGGVWGIESDSGAACLAEFGEEEFGELVDILESLGFSKRTINKHKPQSFVPEFV